MGCHHYALPQAEKRNPVDRIAAAGFVSGAPPPFSRDLRKCRIPFLQSERREGRSVPIFRAGLALLPQTPSGWGSLRTPTGNLPLISTVQTKGHAIQRHENVH